MRRRYLIAGWLWYLGTLVPVIGLVQVGEQAMADRYTYLPSIGIFIMVGWGANELLGRWRYRKMGLGISTAAVLAALLICTRMQVRYWQNNLTLFKHTIEVTRNNFVMHSNFGNALLEEGRIGPAIENYNKALRLKPDYAAAINNLAWILATTEDTRFRNPADAVKLAEKACALTTYKDAEALDTLAAAYAAADRFKKAIETAEKAMELAVAEGRKDLAAEIQDRLRLYQAGQPYRQK
jgi:tetratricopeptide (TPR) repeat protein